MLQIVDNAQLKPFNTFGIAATAQKLCFYQSATDITTLIEQKILTNHTSCLILGGGSNIVFTKDFEGLIIHPQNNYIKIIEDCTDYCLIESGAGTIWDNLVEWAVEHNLHGIENLSGIPGCVGAAPVQNIGAYGAEAKDCIYSVQLVSLSSGETRTISHKECQFGYRDSIFKHEFKGKYLVDSVVFKLNKQPNYKIHYGSITSELEKLGEVSLRNIRKTIMFIRDSKLPDPKKIGSAGSFFKNPTVDKSFADALLAQHPQMVTYDVGDNQVKIAAGWLIDNCGLKGYQNAKRTAGVHDKQALVLVNLGNATGKDIVWVAEMVQENVYKKFGITIEPEAIII